MKPVVTWNAMKPMAHNTTSTTAIVQSMISSSFRVGDFECAVRRPTWSGCQHDAYHDARALAAPRIARCSRRSPRGRRPRRVVPRLYSEARRRAGRRARALHRIPNGERSAPDEGAFGRSTEEHLPLAEVPGEA